MLNILVLSIVICLSAFAWVVNVTVSSNIDKKADALAQNINANLNTSAKNLIRSKIGALDDKFTIYQDFQKQNFDVNKFYIKTTSLYPGLKIYRFVVQPNVDNIDIDLIIPTKGYNEITKFLAALEKDDVYQHAVIKSISFTLPDDSGSGPSVTPTGSSSKPTPIPTVSSPHTMIDKIDKSDVFVTQVSLSIDKPYITQTTPTP